MNHDLFFTTRSEGRFRFVSFRILNNKKYLLTMTDHEDDSIDSFMIEFFSDSLSGCIALAQSHIDSLIQEDIDEKSQVRDEQE